MSVFDSNCRRNDSARLYQSRIRKAAADLPPDHKEECCAREERISRKMHKSELLDRLFEEFLDGGMDSDKLLIAALLYMLIKEGADIKLIIALGYILM
ncbi:MAG: hypothetical protein K6G33_05590 [Ruminococcus sp.]|uniref:hypothetical protein n=1 Tax=Ruminococcus sp. TaxID=41978 RepID=UPI0025F030B5|nr:hypothetical protein [Ruminococcus sp.]MCR5600198.1 hypothetical protein [Ruminococcus sp.]